VPLLIRELGESGGAIPELYDDAHPRSPSPAAQPLLPNLAAERKSAPYFEERMLIGC
jgi:hypothetical protein